MSYSLYHEFLGQVARYPSLFKAWYWVHRFYRPLVVSRSKEIVIEGFPRCANSFTVLAFEQAQGRPVAIAHHLHAEAQVLLGIRYGLPILVLTREPVGAVTSLVTRHPEMGVGQAMKRYIMFYGAVANVQDKVVLADFREVTTNFAQVIDRLNSRYLTHYTPYHNSDAEDASVFAAIETLNRERFHGAEGMTSIPTEAKKKLLDARRGEVLSHPLLEQAQAIFARICSTSPALAAGHDGKPSCAGS